MKNLVIIFFLSLSSYGQDIDYINSQDTIYIMLVHIERGASVNFKTFTFLNSSNKYRKESTLTDNQFNSRSVFISESITKYDKVVKVKRNKFLKDNIDKIIDMNFIDKFSLFKVFVEPDLSGKKRVFYTVSSSNKNSRKLELRKVRIGYTGFIEM